MPYCWAAKSMTKERGATQRAVECDIPILVVTCFEVPEYLFVGLGEWLESSSYAVSQGCNFEVVMSMVMRVEMH